MAQVRYHIGGWVPPQNPVIWEHPDHGRDLAIGGNHVLCGPGNGLVVNVLSDAGFPNGFGPAYPIVELYSGRFAGYQWYLGHTTSLLHAGQRFHFGQPIAVANQSEHVAGWPAGWVELGQAYGGGPGYDNPPHWYEHLFSDLVVNVPDPPVQRGNRGPSVLLLTRRLVQTGDLKFPNAYYGMWVAKAVAAFQSRHHIKRTGVTDAHTWLAIKYAAAACVKKHHKEV